MAPAAVESSVDNYPVLTVKSETVSGGHDKSRARKPYRVIVADPPWRPDDSLGDRGAEANYRTMTTPEICAFLQSLDVEISSTSILFLWRLSNMQRDALDVIDAWGFRQLSETVWEKLTKEGLDWFGLGRTVRESHETALIAVRGSASDVVVSKSVRSRFSAHVPVYEPGDPNIGRVIVRRDGTKRVIKVGDYIHSAKPPAFFSKIVAPLVGTAGPNLELFARRRRPGWTCIGDELPPG